jgi:hypothetical protein
MQGVALSCTPGYHRSSFVRRGFSVIFDIGSDFDGGVA